MYHPRRAHTTAFVNQSWSTCWNDKLLNGSTMRDRSDDPSHHEQMLHHGALSRFFDELTKQNQTTPVNQLSDWVHPTPPFPPTLHDWHTTSCGMCCPACGKLHIKAGPCKAGSRPRPDRKYKPHFKLLIKHFFIFDLYFISINVLGIFFEIVIFCVKGIILILFTISIFFAPLLLPVGVGPLKIIGP